MQLGRLSFALAPIDVWPPVRGIVEGEANFLLDKTIVKNIIKINPSGHMLHREFFLKSHGGVAVVGECLSGLQSQREMPRLDWSFAQQCKRARDSEDVEDLLGVELAQWLNLARNNRLGMIL